MGLRAGMKSWKKLAAVAALLCIAGCGGAPSDLKGLPPGDYFWMRLTQGDLTFRLFPDKAPMAVANTIGLANGTRPYYDPYSKKIATGHFFDGQIFFRLEPGQLIQGGDNYNTGVGTPGFRFSTEADASAKFDREGLIALANAGPENNASQFFITFEPMPGLNGQYSLFGELVKGQDVLHKLAQMPMNRFQPAVHAPNEEIKMKTVRAYHIDANGKVSLAEMDKNVKLPEAKIPVLPPGYGP